MLYRNPGPRPAIATFFGLVSLIWASVMLGWVLVVVAVAILLGAGSWLLSPVAGVAGTAIAAVVVLYCIVSSMMSFLLLWAGWLVLRGDPAGVRLLRLWAWTTLIFDTVILLFSGGASVPSWGAVLFAVAVLYFTRPLAIDERWVTADGSNPYHDKPRFAGDADF